MYELVQYKPLMHHCYFVQQAQNLTGELRSVDIATKENLTDLETVGEDLLDKNVCRIKLETGEFEEVEKETKGKVLFEFEGHTVKKGTNRHALIEFAKLLSAERKLRQSS